MLAQGSTYVRIFDVAHGFCAYLAAESGNIMMIDCSHNDSTQFYPASYFLRIGCTGIERFFVTNYDEDHISGLPYFRSLHNRMPISILHRNTSISADQLRALKKQSGPIGDGMNALLTMIDQYAGEVTNAPVYPNVYYHVAWNDYPIFSDTNNLSLVLFVRYKGISICFPGDLEKAGWLELLKNQRFRDHLSAVNVFVASHHGRESGYCKEVFGICNPDIVIISDESIKYETQEVNYSQHAIGIRWNNTDNLKKVLTTRNNGMITITAVGETGYHVQASS